MRLEEREKIIDAIRKLTEAKVKTFQNKRDFLVPHLREALCGFVEQDEDFAAAVMAACKPIPEDAPEADPAEEQEGRADT